MLSFNSNGIRGLCFAAACFAGLAAPSWSRAAEPPPADVEAPETLPTPAADAPSEELPPASEKTPVSESEAASASQARPAAEPTPSDIEAVQRAVEPDAEVAEFARRLAEKLKITGPHRRPTPRPAWESMLTEEACPGDCPICGAPLNAMDDSPIASRKNSRWRKVPHVDWLFKDIDVKEMGIEQANEQEEKLQPGEPAQVILELREKLGASAVRGTEFTVEPKTFARWVRALDRENPRQQLGVSVEVPPSGYAGYSDADYSADVDEATISALRGASRQLDDAAELLEQQNLFERADQLRDQADQLRRDARAYLKERIVPAPNARTEHKATAALQSLACHVPLVFDFFEDSLAAFRDGFDARHPSSRESSAPRHSKSRQIFQFFVAFAR